MDSKQFINGDLKTSRLVYTSVVLQHSFRCVKLLSHGTSLQNTSKMCGQTWLAACFTTQFEVFYARGKKRILVYHNNYVPNKFLWADWKPSQRNFEIPFFCIIHYDLKMLNKYKIYTHTTRLSIER